MSSKKTGKKTEKKIEKKVVRIRENDLVDLIDNIVTEAVSEKKKEWLAEYTKTKNNKDSLLEGRIEKLEKVISNAKITKTVKTVKAAKPVAAKS